MSYIEKAYAVFRGANSYNRLNTTTQLGEAPTVNRVMEDLAGPFDFADIGEGRLYRSGADSAPLSDAVLRDVLAHPVFQRGEVTTNFIEREFAAWQPALNDHSDLALIAAALADTQSATDFPTTNHESRATHSDPWLVNDSFRIGG